MRVFRSVGSVESDGRPAISVSGLSKSFGEVQALSGVDLDVAGGAVLGLLGPNGAGKTTFVRILTTLLKPDAGTARVVGLDVVREAAKVRERIGLAGQYAAVDENLTGLENLTMVGRLYGASRRVAKAPTTGLDPRGRFGMWDVIEGLVAEGTTVLLTTQYLDEADRLADTIAVIDHGRLIVQGTSDELKDRVGGERLEVKLVEGVDGAEAARVLASMADGLPAAVDGLVTLNVRERRGAIVEAVRRLSDAGIGVDDLAVRRPTLDDVFLTLTGHAAEDDAEEEKAA